MTAKVKDKTKFFQFRQNNSGGSFDIDIERGISVCVIVEAKDSDHANSIAQGLGIYFDGTGDYSEDDEGYGSYDGVDCSCCGDRWYSADEAESDSRPTYYGQLLTKGFTSKDVGLSDFKWTEKEQPEIIVHYLDGRVVGYEPYLEIKGKDTK